MVFCVQQRGIGATVINGEAIILARFTPSIERGFNFNKMLFFLGVPLVGDPVLKNIGPVTLVVTNSETGLPLKDIIVYYQLQKHRTVRVNSR